MVWVGTLILAIGLSGCDAVEAPIQAYRSVIGINKNDPDPETAPYTPNLHTAEIGPSPNLASVPPPPLLSSTGAERQKLADSLAGQRSSTEAKDAGGTPGTASSGPVPPPPPIPPSIAAPEMAALPPPTQKPATPVEPARKMDEPPLPMPSETTMQTPQVANVPGVEPSHAAPGQGRPSGMPQPESSSLPPAAVQSGNPQPAPAQATLPEPKVSPQVAALPPPKLPPKPTVVASLDPPVGSAALATDERSRLDQVVAQYRENPRTVRVVAYAAPGVGSAEQLNAFRAALDRAQLIAKELTDAGVPASKIQTEAAPSGATDPPGRIEVQLLQ